MKISKKILANLVKATAETALRRDANSTTCISFYQPKAPEKLTRFKAKK